MKKTIYFSLVAFLILLGCSKPDDVSVVNPGENQLKSASWASPTQAQKPTAVSITVPFTYTTGEFPNFTFDGPFTMTGAISASGNATMVASLNKNAMVYHCTWTLTNVAGTGTITLHEQCEMGSNPVKGRWEIVSGTGDYENLRGNGSALMPDVGDPSIYQEDLTGVIFK